MPSVRVLLFKEGGACPFLTWFSSLSERARAKGRVRIARLAAEGHALRRPEVENIGEGIYELRWKEQRVNYRALYFFHGREAVVLSQGFTKEDRIPPAEIERAKTRRTLFVEDPASHTWEGGIS